MYSALYLTEFSRDVNVILTHFRTGKKYFFSEGPSRSCLRKKSTQKKKQMVRPLSEKQINPWRARETKDEARLKRRELSHTTCIVVQLQPVVTLPSSERGNTLERANPHRLTFSNTQPRGAARTARHTDLYETKFILYFTYLYINISSLK